MNSTHRGDGRPVGHAGSFAKFDVRYLNRLFERGGGACDDQVVNGNEAGLHQGSDIRIVSPQLFNPYGFQGRELGLEEGLFVGGKYCRYGLPLCVPQGVDFL